MDTEPRRVFIRPVNQHGNQIAPDREVGMITPEHVPTNGLASVESYVARLFRSEAAFVSLIISSADRQKGLSFHRRGAEFMFSIITVDEQNIVPQEVRVREFFSRRGVAPTQDYQTRVGNRRILHYPAGDSEEQVLTNGLSLLREVYSITEEEGLTFYFNEHQQSDKM